mgnify:CR=1 FL=1
MKLVREKRIKEEDGEREKLNLIYKEKIIKAEQEKLAQLAIATKLKEGLEEEGLEEEEKRLEESQEQAEIIQPEEEKKG